MKSLITSLMVLALSLFSTVHAATITIDTSNMTKEEIVQKVEQVQSLIVSDATESEVQSSPLSDWKAIGKDAGEMIVAFTTEVGIAAKEFAMSPTGLIVTVLAAVYFFGHTVMSYVIGIVLCIVATRIINRCFSSAENIVVSEKTNSDGTVDKKFKMQYVLRLTKVSTQDFIHVEGVANTYFVYAISMVVANIPGLLFIINA